MMERPDWNTGDVVRSVRGVILLGKRALAEVLDKIDTHFADRINCDDD